MKIRFKNINWDTVGWICIAIFFGSLFIRAEGWKALKAPTLSDEKLEQIIEANK